MLEYEIPNGPTQRTWGFGFQTRCFNEPTVSENLYIKSAHELKESVEILQDSLAVTMTDSAHQTYIPGPSLSEQRTIPLWSIRRSGTQLGEDT